MRACRILVLSFLAMGVAASAGAQNPPVVSDFRCFNADTFATGLNDAGQAVGWYGSQAFEDSHSFIRKKNGPCEAIPDVPDSDATIAFGVNDPGQIVGIYFPGKTGNGSAFLYEKGVHLKFDYPDLGSTQDKQVCQTFAIGINNRGQIVGLYDLWRLEGENNWVCNGPDYPFMREADGTYVTLHHGWTTDSVQTNGINARGMTIGNYLKLDTCTEQGCKEYGYIRYPDGLTASIRPEGGWDTMPTGINALGEVVGRYFTEPWLAPIGPCHSFFRGTDGTIVELKYPDSSSNVTTCVGGINAPGEVSGAWTTDWVNGPWHGFVVDLKVLLPPAP